jgi:hypothetical protein
VIHTGRKLLPFSDEVLIRATNATAISWDLALANEPSSGASIWDADDTSDDPAWFSALHVERSGASEAAGCRPGELDREPRLLPLGPATEQDN